MKLIDSIRFRMAALFRPSKVNAELEEELRSHIQHRADDLERSGMPRAQAERRARIEFGGREKYKEECHEALGGNFFETLLQDVRISFRTLLKSPNFTGVAVLTLALGIGANAIVFSVLNALILRPLNLPGARDLYMIERGQGSEDSSPMQSYPDYRDLRDRNRSLQGLVAYDIDTAALDTGGNPSPVWLYEASGNYFDVLGVQPYLGRFFHSSDEHGPNSAPYIVLSYGYWQSHFNSDTGVPGRVVQLNKHPYTILGVAPPQFRGSELYFSPAFWVPMVNTEQVAGASDLEDRASRGIWLVGRLKPGVTPAQAASDLNSIAATLAKTYPKEDGQANFSLVRPGLLGNMLGRPVRAFVSGMMLLAGLILLAACANLGSLFAARTADRSKETALRLALGSSRRRVLRQMLTEAVLVSITGGFAGVLASVVLLRWLSAWQPLTDMPINVPVNPDVKVYAVALLLALASGFLFGIVPVRQVLQANPYQIVKSGSAGATGRRFTARDLLLVLQIAVCAVLVTASLVAARGMVRSLHSNLGFQPQNAVLANTDLTMAGYSGDHVPAMQRRLLDTLERLPGVTAVGLVDRLPLAMEWSDQAIFKEDATDLRLSNEAAEAGMQAVSPGYLHAAGTTLLAGRNFTWHDDKNSPRVAIVNQEFARRLFGSEAAAMGGYFKNADGTRIQVVGIVEDGKYKTITEAPEPASFMPILQAPSSSTWLVVRSKEDPQQVAAAVHDALRNLDEAVPFRIKTWDRQLDSALFASRVATVSLGVLGGLGAMLAVTGIFGMASYSVSKRLRELGIRIALGARRKEVLESALGRVLRLLAAGSVAGLLLGLAATKVLSFIVYQATPRDPVVLLGVVVTMLLLGLLAAWIPARRALAADPLMLLREE
jgi:macrolide transport system ATP-binding/permease protein